MLHLSVQSIGVGDVQNDTGAETPNRNTAQPNQAQGQLQRELRGWAGLYWGVAGLAAAT